MKEFTLESCIMFTTNTSARLFRQVLAHKLQAVHLSYNSWITLYFIHSRAHITQGQLAQFVGVTEPSMVNITKHLMEQGLISQTADPEDHRRRFLSLTEYGKQQYTKTIAIVTQFQREMTAGITQQDLDQAVSVLDQMTANAKKDLAARG